MGEGNCCQKPSELASNLYKLFPFFLAHLGGSAMLNKKRTFVNYKNKKGKYRDGTSHFFPQFPILDPKVVAFLSSGFFCSV